MKRHMLHLIVIIFLACVSISCGLASVNPFTKSTPSLAFTPTPDTSNQAVASLTTTPAGEPTLEPTLEPTPPPENLNDYYFSTLAAGKQTEGHLLLSLLKFYAGEATAADTFGGQEVTISEQTGIRQMAQKFVKANPGAAENSEIQRLLGLLAPTADQLMPYAQPEDQATSAEILLTSFEPSFNRQQEDCDNLWEAGFPKPAPGAKPQVCILYRTVTAGGKQHRIFYPKYWPKNDPRRQYLDWTADAIKKSIDTYLPLASKGINSSDFVFVQLVSYDPATNKFTDDAYAATDDTSPTTCTTPIYGLAFNLPADKFKQAIAHELFHCFQFLNMSKAYSASYSDSQWWVEGSAVYFSNVVYPTANQEYEFIAFTDARSPTTSLFKMNYDSFMLFQFLGNKLGNQKLIQVLTSFPSEGSEDAYGAALNSEIDNMEDLFHEFGKEYLNSAIPDTGGGNIPNLPRFGAVKQISDGNTSLETKPFVLTRYTLQFAKERKFTIKQMLTGDGKDSARPGGPSGAWGDLPMEVNTACDTSNYLLLLTETNPGQTTQMDISATSEEAKTCDRCLVGTWKVNIPSYDAYMGAIMNRGITQHVSVSGDLTLHFDAGGTVTFTWTNLTSKDIIHQKNIDGKPLDWNINTIETGQSSGEWAAVKGVIKYMNTKANVSIKTLINGMDMSGKSPVNISQMGTDDSKYICKDNQLTIFPNLQNISVPPITYTKIGK